jgi:hypothetical protein
MSTPDDYIHAVAEVAAARMTQTGLPGRLLRERTHLDPFMKDESAQRSGARPVSKKLLAPEFPRLGPVDVVIAEPRMLIELKWSYERPGKTFESVWDAIKLVLLGARHGYDALYVATGASRDDWTASESSDLFSSGDVDMLDIWARALTPPRGPNYGATIGEDLLIGGDGNQPLRAHSRLGIRRIAELPVADDFELRIIRVAAAGPIVDWPQLTAPGPLRTKPLCAPGTVTDVQLPARVTQAWIERTAPCLTAPACAPFLEALRARDWSDAELEVRVLPHMPTFD